MALSMPKPFRSRLSRASRDPPLGARGRSGGSALATGEEERLAFQAWPGRPRLRDTPPVCSQLEQGTDPLLAPRLGSALGAGIKAVDAGRASSRCHGWRAD